MLTVLVTKDLILNKELIKCNCNVCDSEISITNTFTTTTTRICAQCKNKILDIDFILSTRWRRVRYVLFGGN